MNALRFVTDGGMETDLIFHGGIDLPEFAAYPLLATASGREALSDYYDGYARIAAERGSGSCSKPRRGAPIRTGARRSDTRSTT